MNFLAELPYRLRSGHRSKAGFFARGVASLLVPRPWWRARRKALLDSIAQRPDAAEIRARAAYCCPWGSGETPLPPDAATLRDFRFPRRSHVYWFDAMSAIRYFPSDLRWIFVPGDISFAPQVPSVVKARPVGESGRFGTLLALNTVRHFVFADDAVPFRDKSDTACFRGKVPNKPLRVALFERWFGHPLLDLGDTSEHPARPEWARPKMTLRQQLRCKFVVSVEGNDVASNLKWILSSNSVPVMPRPRFETCFEEGRLVPGVHYIETAPDFSDLPDVIRRYAAHPDECERIAAAGRAWAARFRDPARERLVAVLTMQRYFLATGQDPDAAGRGPVPAETAMAEGGSFL